MKINKKQKRTSAHYNKGLCNIETGFMLSAPGRYEKISGRPAAKTTGNNLESLIEILNSNLPNIFPHKDRYSYRITNAEKKIHYKTKTNDTEGRDKDILSDSNIDRILSETTGIKYLFCLGDKASLTIEKLKEKGFEGKIYSDIHIGMKSLNFNIKKDVDGNVIQKGEKGNTQKRIQVVANRIIHQLIDDK
jgi:hypothetical protein